MSNGISRSKFTLDLEFFRNKIYKRSITHDPMIFGYKVIIKSHRDLKILDFPNMVAPRSSKNEFSMFWGGLQCST